MLTLALETSTNQGGVAITESDRDKSVIRARFVWARGQFQSASLKNSARQSHGEALTAAIEKVLADAGLKAANLDQIAVGVGPGSFTGIRIAVNAARTLGYSLGKPLRSFDTLEILAEGAREVVQRSAPDRITLVLVNAHKNLMYASRFRLRADGSLERLSAIEALSLEQVSALILAQPCVGVGDGCAEWDELWEPSVRAALLRLPDVSDEPLPETLAHLAESSQAEPLSWQELQPLYIRLSEPEEKLRAGLLKDRSKINE